MNMDKNKKLKKTTSCGSCVHRMHNNKIQLLLIRPFKESDRWGIPKGHVDDGETLEETALRETKEETGLDVILGEKLTVVSTIYRNEEKYVHSYLATVVGDDTPRPQDPDGEIFDIRWFDIDSLPDVHIYQRPLIAETISALEAIYKAN